MGAPRFICFEDGDAHCSCGHQARDHEGELGKEKRCTYRRCDCEQFEHSADADQWAAEQAWRFAR